MADSEILAALHEIRDLVRLIAEPQIAARDKKLRDELIGIVGEGAAKRKAVLAMDGSRTQMEIHRQTGMNAGNLSTLVKKLSKAQLLTGDMKQPKLAFPIPSNFFDQEGGPHE
jgi:hypothetical protein